MTRREEYALAILLGAGSDEWVSANYIGRKLVGARLSTSGNGWGWSATLRELRRRGLVTSRSTGRYEPLRWRITADGVSALHKAAGQ